MILAANLWAGVPYVLRFTSAPDTYAIPAEQLVGPFDDTTELNRVDAPSGPAGSVHVNVTWQGGRSSTPFDLNGVCACLSPGGPTGARRSRRRAACKTTARCRSTTFLSVTIRSSSSGCSWTASSQYVMPGLGSGVGHARRDGVCRHAESQLRKLLVTVHTADVDSQDRASAST